MEKLAASTQREQDLDLADYLIQLDWRKFNSAKSKKGGTSKKIAFFNWNAETGLYYENGMLMKDGYPADWDLV